MHVVVAGWLLPVGAGGATTRTLELLRAMPPLLKAGERVTVLGPETLRPGLQGFGDGIAWASVNLPVGPTMRRAWLERRRLPKLLRDMDATVFDQSFLPLADKLPCPSTVTLHDLRDLTEFRRRNRALSRWLLRRSLRRAAATIVPSEAVAVQVNAELGTKAGRIEVIPGGVAETFFNLEANPQGYLLHVGHLEPRKNLDVLLHAMAQDADILPLKLVGGDGGSEQQLRALAESLGLGERVQFVGSVSDEERDQLYAGANGVVIPSKLEGFGLPALEALASGKALAVSDRGSLPEVVGDAAEVLPADDASAWVTAMREMSMASGAGPEQREHRRAHARTFSWTRAATLTLQLWRSLA